MEVTEITSAFSEKRNNGYGLSFKLCLDSSIVLGRSKLVSKTKELHCSSLLNVAVISCIAIDDLLVMLPQHSKRVAYTIIETKVEMSYQTQQTNVRMNMSST